MTGYSNQQLENLKQMVEDLIDSNFPDKVIEKAIKAEPRKDSKIKEKK